MRIGILTGGGDAPGLNSIIESSAKVLLNNGVEVVGIRDGFLGIFEEHTLQLTHEVIEDIHSAAGTLLGTTNKCGTDGRETEFLEKFKSMKLDGLIAAGGDGTFSGLRNFEKDIHLIGVPKTIDNDLSGTEITFGYDTACSVVAEAIDSLRATADSHQRIIVVETMGRTAGWIALGGGLASYADAILLPERPFNRAKFLEFLRGRHASGQRGLLIAVSEGAFAEGENPKIMMNVSGAPQSERFGGIAYALARWIESETTWEARHVVLGHLQRSRPPTTTDRFLTMAMGVEVARMALEKAWGQAAVYRKGEVIRAPITDLMGPARLVKHDHRWVRMAQALNIYI